MSHCLVTYVYTAHIGMCFPYTYNSLITFSANSSSKLILQLNFISCVLWCLSICVKPLGVTKNGGNKESKCPPMRLNLINVFVYWVEKGQIKNWAESDGKLYIHIKDCFKQILCFCLIWLFDLNANTPWQLFTLLTIVIYQLTHMLQLTVFS